MEQFTGSWIWTEEAVPQRNSYVRFRRTFEYYGGKALLRITADSRYIAYVNGEYLGQGPVRCWPGHYRYDEYDLQAVLIPGNNVISVVVNHYGESTFQYIDGNAGLLADIELENDTIPTDERWKSQPGRSFISLVPRISVQEAFEEQYDARNDDGWREPGYNDSAWMDASVLRPPVDGCHDGFAPSGIPFLTAEPVIPRRVVAIEKVHSIPHIYTICTRPYLDPTDTTSNSLTCNAFLATQIWSEKDTDIKILFPHKGPRAVKLNGQLINSTDAKLKSGYNSLIMSIQGLWHATEFSICIDGPENLRFSCTADELGSPWAIVGPFDIDEDAAGPEYDFDNFQYLHGRIAKPAHASATWAASIKFWENADVSRVMREPYFKQILSQHIPEVDVFLQSYTDKVISGEITINHKEGFLSGNDWVTVNPPEDNSDVRILLDFGHEVLAYHEFEVDSYDGVILDFHNFEFIQPDGRLNFAEGMNNAFRYTCRNGRQKYRSYLRRGFQYSYLTIRNFTDPIKLRGVKVLFASYPLSNQGSFTCSDTKLDKIWQAGKLSLRCCAEDTYTDCPTYEQTHWVGDARNEALVDWAVSGDPRLWYRCVEQVGDSLDRSTITESQVPSGWQNILPAWTFLWMRSCKEYVLHSGDIKGGRKLLGYLSRNANGFRTFLNDQGLFEITGWNMFDWAAMDTPSHGVVTHQNCLAVHAFKDAADLAGWLGRDDLKSEWSKLAADLSDSINTNLWNEEKQAYTDCIRDGGHSPVYSQQTQTAAYISGVASGEKAIRCREIMQNPPEGFVIAGSPFFEFFLLEAYCREGRIKEMIDAIRKDWGFMVDAGATTFWEMWSAGYGFGRLTRSHCHGWSAAPTYFLSSYVLGIRPGGPGFKPVVIEPRPGDLKWARGVMPTPQGNVEVQWENESDRPFILRINASEKINFIVNLPRDGKVILNGVEVS